MNRNIRKAKRVFQNPLTQPWIIVLAEKKKRKKKIEISRSEQTMNRKTEYI